MNAQVRPLDAPIDDRRVRYLYASERTRCTKRSSNARCARTDALVPVGMPVLLDLPRHPQDKTTVIENGVQLDVFAPRDIFACTQMAAPDFLRSITLGNLTTSKNQELLL